MNAVNDHVATGAPSPHVAEWFFLIAGVVYATGYLVVLTYLDAFGIHEGAADSLKLRYMHVGLLCIIPPAIGLAFFYAFALLRRAARDSGNASPAAAPTPSTATVPEQPAPASGGAPIAKHPPSSPPLIIQPKRTVPSRMGAILLLNVLFVFYFVIVFMPTGFFRQQFYWLLGLFLGTIIGMLLINDYSQLLRPTLISSLTRLLARPDEATINELINKARHLGARTDGVLLKGALLCIMLGVGTACLWGHWSDVGHVLWPTGTFYFITTLSIIALTAILHVRSTRYPGPDGQRGMLAVRVCLLGPLCMLCVLGFAHGIFPWIPASKGGANFSEVPRAILVLDEKGQQCLPAALSSEKGVVVLEVSAETVYVAEFDSYHAWERQRQEDPLHTPARPFVWSIGRKQIRAIRYGATGSE